MIIDLVEDGKYSKLFQVRGPDNTVYVRINYYPNLNRTQKVQVKGVLDQHHHKITNWSEPDLKGFLMRYIGDTFIGSREEWINDLWRSSLDTITFESDGDDEFTITIEGSTDIITTTKSRREQKKLRNLLLKAGSESECHLCGRFVPVSLLICAHIKKRSKSASNERVDKSIVLPMCVFGCDKMFEDGWIGVSRSGKVVRLNHKKSTPDLELEIEKLLGRDVPGWDDMSEKYFSWHRDFHTRPRESRISMPSAAVGTVTTDPSDTI